MRWQNITLRQFQFIEAVNEDSSYDELDKTMHTTCILFNQTENTFGELGAKKATTLINKTNKCFSKPFPTNPAKWVGYYLINYNIDKIRFGQYVELTHFLQGKTIENAAQILASVAHLPLQKNNSDKHQSISEYFLDKPVTKILPSVKMVIEKFANLNLEYAGLFDIEETIDSEPEEPQQEQQQDGFNKVYGWVYSATVVAEHERITLEETFELPVRQALNDLAYLKAKRQYDEEQLKRQTKSYATQSE